MAGSLLNGGEKGGAVRDLSEGVGLFVPGFGGSYIKDPQVHINIRRSKSPHKHQDPTNHDFWNPPHIGPWKQNVRSLCLCGLLGPDTRSPILLGPYLGAPNCWKLPHLCIHK